MSEDRLEKALQEMKQEDVDAGTLEAARARVWDEVTNAAGASCAEFRPDFRAYLSGELGGSRRVLMEDHLSRCPACRASMAEMKGERRVIAMPQRSSSRWVRWGSLAAAAALVLAVLYLGRDAIDAMMAPGGPRATVVSADGGLYRLPGGALAAGASIGEKELVRTGPGAHAVLRLADGSMVDVNERTELFVTAAWSGRAIHLQRGDVIVRAAKQRRGHLRVLTRDSIASVKGTVFAVSAGMGGSVVSVVEGSVAVNQPGREVVLSPGEQAASNPALATSVAGSRRLEPRGGRVPGAARLVREDRTSAGGQLPGELRTSSALLSYLPAGAFVYGAVPNLGGTIGQALVLAEQQASENAAFGAWWNSETGRLLRQMVDRVQSVSSLLGDEIVFCVGSPGPGERGADGDGPRAVRQAGGAGERPGRAVRRGGRACPAVFGVRRPDGRLELAGAPGVGPRSPGAGRQLPVCGSHRGAVPARRRLADRHGCGPGGRDGGRRRCAAGRARRHDRDEVPLPRAACPRGCGRERGHAGVPGRAKGDGVLAG